MLACIVYLHQAYSQIIINEFQADNSSTIEEPESGNYEDWVELHNAGSEQVDISGYYLTNEKSDTTKWQIPSGTIIPANGFLLIWLDNKDNDLHASFKLDKNGDIIILYDDSQQRLDILNFDQMDEDVSFGRATDGGSLWASYSTPTPGGPNYTVASILKAPEPIFGTKAGYYQDAVTVNLWSVLADADIYYTTDGSIPTIESARYSEPINVSTSSVIKAVVIRAGYNNSRVSTHSYFIGEHESDLPVISIGVDPYDFFDETEGMYMMGPYAMEGDPNWGANFWEDIEEPVTFEYFVNGKQKVEVNAGIKIFGGWSRRFEQRSFTINCRQEYGDERMRYQFFEDKEIDVFKQIVVRNSGSDVYSLRYRDLMLQKMVSNRMDIDYQDGVPTIVYINGEYWGIMNLREKVQERYLKDNYGLEKEDVTLIANYQWESEDGGSIDEFTSLFDYVSYNDLSDDANYNSVTQMMDIDEFINYQITEIYYGNHDWPGLNIKYWKENGNGHQWRWILYDLDQSTAYYEDCNQYRNSLSDATIDGSTHWANDPNSTMFLRKLLENENFKNEFVQRFAAHMNSTFSTERFRSFIDDYENTYANEKPYHLERWGYNDSLWNVERDELYLFADERPALMQGFMMDMFGISGMANLTVTSQNEINPGFEICSVLLEGDSVSGDYFTNTPITVSAKQTTRRFLRWEDQDGNTLSSEMDYTLTLENDLTIVAVYDQSSGLVNVFINEFMASNTNTFADEKGDYDDWIELYNANDFAVDISGLYLTDGFDNPDKFLIPQGEGNETVIPAHGYIVLWADEEKSEGTLHLNFKLSSSGEELGLAQIIDEEISWIDSVSFSSQSEDISYGRSADGGDNFVFMSNTTPNASNVDATGIDDIVEDVFINVFPVVVDDFFTVETNSKEQPEIEIFSLTGNKVDCAEIAVGNTTQINSSALYSGVYLVKVSDNAYSKTFKIIKK